MKQTGSLSIGETFRDNSDVFEISARWVGPVPYACAQPYHPGSGSHGQLFRPRESGEGSSFQP